MRWRRRRWSGVLATRAGARASSTVSGLSNLPVENNLESAVDGQRRIYYWGVTSVVALQCIVGGIMGALRLEPFLGVIRHLGYPDYFMVILGVSYVLAGLTLLAPAVPRLKEWAYVGLVFNYTGAAVSHLAARDGLETLIAPLISGALTIASRSLRPTNRRG